VGIERSDEIGALARAIERMGVSIKMAFERLRSKAA
jgi:methyl-accepting chemotaxis protein